MKKNMLFDGMSNIASYVLNFLQDYPSKKLYVIGVSGFYGQSSIVFLLYKLLEELKIPAVGVCDFGVFGLQKEKTPKNPYEIQKLLNKAVSKNKKIVILQQDIEKIEKKMYSGVLLDGLILADLSADEVNFYNEYKVLKNFVMEFVRNEKKDKVCVVPVDSNFGREIFQQIPLEKRISYSIAASSFLKATNISLGLEKTVFEVNYLGQVLKIETNLLGYFNVYAILASLGMLIALNIPLSQTIPFLKKLESVGGLKGKKIDNYWYFEDLHTTLLNIEFTLSFLNQWKKNRLIVVLDLGEKYVPQINELLKKMLVNVDITILSHSSYEFNVIKKSLGSLDISEGVNFFVIPEKLYALKFAKEIAKEGDIVFYAVNYK